MTDNNSISSFDFALETSDTYTGSDIQALIIIPEDEKRIQMAREYLDAINELLNGQDPVTLADAQEKVLRDFNTSTQFESNLFLPLVNLQSFTVSTFRQKAQVRTLGRVNPAGIARGSRTIAGTMILAEFTKDAFWKILQERLDDSNIGDSGAVLADQMAPFNLLLLFSNELGRISYRMIYNIEIVTNGVVYSIQDMYTENTVSWMATDITPLVELADNALNLASINPDLEGPPRNRISPTQLAFTGKEVVRRFRHRINSRNNNL